MIEGCPGRRFHAGWRCADAVEALAVVSPSTRNDPGAGAGLDAPFQSSIRRPWQAKLDLDTCQSLLQAVTRGYALWTTSRLLKSKRQEFSLSFGGLLSSPMAGSSAFWASGEKIDLLFGPIGNKNIVHQSSPAEKRDGFALKDRFIGILQ